jgi:alanine transaminase
LRFLSLTRTERDGHPADATKIYITAGASVGVSNLLQALVSSPLDGVLIPIPQYPLYTAALALNAARPVPYYLDESAEWGLDIEDLRKNVEKARHDGTVLKGMVVINPGNPTGNCLTLENMQDIIKLCYEERLVLMADEVYQDNIYHPGKPFISFKKALRDMDAKYADNVELVSFHSISKGQSGECGRRGGYFELTNFHPEAEEQIYKLASIQLCPSLGGQIGVDVLVCPPKEGEESYPLWKKERDGISETLKERSEILLEAFNELEGVTCNEAHVSRFSVYLFDHSSKLITLVSRYFRHSSLSFLAIPSLPPFQLLRAPCTSSLPSPSLKKLSPKPNPVPSLPTPSTVSNY